MMLPVPDTTAPMALLVFELEPFRVRVKVLRLNEARVLPKNKAPVLFEVKAALAPSAMPRLPWLKVWVEAALLTMPEAPSVSVLVPELPENVQAPVPRAKSKPLMLRLAVSCGLKLTVAAWNEPMSVVRSLAGAWPPDQLALVPNAVAVFPQTIVRARSTTGDQAKHALTHKAASSLLLSRCVGVMVFMSGDLVSRRRGESALLCNQASAGDRYKYL